MDTIEQVLQSIKGVVRGAVLSKEEKRAIRRQVAEEDASTEDSHHSQPLLLDGRAVRESRVEGLRKEIAGLRRPPRLSVVVVGERADSLAYVEQKVLLGRSLGAEVEVSSFSDRATVTAQDVEDELLAKNSDPEVDGIILQLPLPAEAGWDASRLVEAIDPVKDVDGLTARNQKRLLAGDMTGPGHIPATARGVLGLLDYYRIEVAEAEVAVVGRSTLVGMPIALALLARNATVTLCHSQTPDLAAVTSRVGILVTATGAPGLIGRKEVSPGQVVVDVGINLVESDPAEGRASLEEEIAGRRFVGDVDFPAVAPVVRAISPVPGGVGPMTVLSLFENLLDAARTRENGV